MAEPTQKTDRFADFNAKVVAALENAAQITGEVIVDYGRDLLSVPVERLGAGIVVRSQPGEPPRKDEGELQAELQHDVDKTSPSEVLLTFTTTRFSTPAVPAILEFGEHPIEARPYFVADDAGKDSMRTRTRKIGLNIAATELKKVT